MKPYPLVDELLGPILRVGMPRASRLPGFRYGGDKSRWLAVRRRKEKVRLRSGGAPPTGSERESERGLDRNLESGSLGFLPGPGGAALEIQERIADHLPGARMQMHEDPRLHLAGNRILRVTDGHIQDVALLVVAVNQGLCHRISLGRMRSTTIAVLTYPAFPDGLISAMTSTHNVPFPAVAGQADFKPGNIADPQEVGCHKRTIGATRLPCQGLEPGTAEEALAVNDPLQPRSPSV